ncbi:MAG: response regulator transcription factor, partial [Verrucomicrobia bacterium]|nr:response regulator transcription factor [Verrucomicrobiota bacterium]
MPDSASRRKRSRKEKSIRSGDPVASLSSKIPPEQIRIVVADDHPVAREGLASILNSFEGMQVVGEAADGKEARELYARLSPDVLIVDLRMPEKDGVQVVKELMSG